MLKNLERGPLERYSAGTAHAFVRGGEAEYEAHDFDSAGVYARGAARRDCHHWRAGGVAVAGGADGPGGVAPHQVPEQSEAAWLGYAFVSRHVQEAAVQ